MTSVTAHLPRLGRPTCINDAARANGIHCRPGAGGEREGSGRGSQHCPASVLSAEEPALSSTPQRADRAGRVSATYATPASVRERRAKEGTSSGWSLEAEIGIPVLK